MSNYYVHRSGEDEYLEHALFGFSAKGGTVHNRSGSHKYIAKFNVGGRTRYIYDPRELAAFKAGGRALGNARNAVGGAVSNVRRKAGRFIDRNITGASAKRAYESDKRQKRELNRYNRSLFGRAENAGKRIANVGNNARKAMGNAAEQASKAGKNFAGSIKKEAYRTGYRAKNTAIKLASQAKTNATRYKNKAKLAIDEATGAAAKRRAQVNAKRAKNMGKTLRTSPAAVQAQINADRAKRKYEKSILGRAETAGKRISKAGNSAITTAKNTGKKAGNKLADVSGLTARREFTKAADQSMNLRRGIRSRRGETYNPKDPLEIARDRAQKRADSKLWKTRARYNKTPLGRAEGAITGIYERVGDIKGKLKKRKKRK